jgi:UDP-N-acetylmuramoylalanine--D-glutamate ligase
MVDQLLIMHMNKGLQTLEIKDWDSMKIVILGAARQGTALARYLISRGAKVVINDRRSADELADAQKSLSDLAVEWVLGDHPFSILEGIDGLCLSGGVPLTLPLVVEAVQRGIPLSNDSQVFMDASPCKTIGITGSAGKTTTTSLVGEILRRGLSENISLPYQRVWVGGNIGTPLIKFIDQIEPDDLVVLELSSFQLEIMNRSPQMAMILNITPNHLDRHESMDAYIEAKAHILSAQGADDVAFLNHDDPGAWELRDRVQGTLISFGMDKPLDTRGVFIENGHIYYTDGQSQQFVMDTTHIPLRGQHNLMNVLAACALTCEIGIPQYVLQDAVSNFPGVKHRLEFVRRWGGADWYNDSIATAPERAKAAILSFDDPLVLLAGGRDKDLPWEDFCQLLVERIRYLVLFGEAAGKIDRVLSYIPGNEKLPRLICKSLKEAISATALIVQPGDVVLLSPGGTSFDEFNDFEERGECFRQWVMML